MSKRAEYLREWRKNNKEHYLQTTKEYRERNKVRLKAYRKAYWKKYFVKIKRSPELLQRRREQANKAKKRNYDKNRPKYKARGAVKNALLNGSILRGDCSVAHCDNSPIEAHHPDYNKPLEIVWLCRKHHLSNHND